MEIASASPAHPGRHNQKALQDRIEQAFLEEMLKHSGLSPLQGSFGGGHGEEQFQTFMTREYAELMAPRLDLGLGTVK